MIKQKADKDNTLSAFIILSIAKTLFNALMT